MANTEEQIRQLSSDINDLASQLKGFRKQYDLDMRGDTKVNGGTNGLIHEIRELKKYPSITWLFAHKPGHTVAVALTTFLILMTLWSAGIFAIVAKAFGVEMP